VPYERSTNPRRSARHVPSANPTHHCTTSACPSAARRCATSAGTGTGGWSSGRVRDEEPPRRYTPFQPALMNFVYEDRACRGARPSRQANTSVPSGSGHCGTTPGNGWSGGGTDCRGIGRSRTGQVLNSIDRDTSRAAHRRQDADLAHTTAGRRHERRAVRRVVRRGRVGSFRKHAWTSKRRSAQSQRPPKRT